MAIREASLLGHYATPPADGDRRVPETCRETGAPDPPKPRPLDRVRQPLGTRHYSRRTEKAYVHWIKRYIFFHGKRHPAEMGAAEVTAFLTSLAVQGKVAASTQNQALSALLFLYREVLGIALPWLDDVVRAKRPVYLPVVLTREEVRAVLQRLDGVPRLMAVLPYGAGLRPLECCRLRVKDVDFATNQITIRDGKGHKDRATMLPASVKAELSSTPRAYAPATRRRSPARRGLGRAARRAPAQVPERGPNLGMAVGLPGDSLLCGPRDRSAAPPPPARVGPSAGSQGRGPEHGDCQARHVPYLPALVCHAPPGGEPRHSHRPGAARPPGRQHHDDLHSRSQPGPRWRPEPRRSDVPLIRLCRGQYRPPGHGQISRDVSLYIRAHGRGGVLQGGGNSNVQRARSERFTGIYRTTQFDNTVQDTER